MDESFFEERRKELLPLLEKMARGDVECVEYGDPGLPGGRFSATLRIRYIQTAGGVQFQVRDVTSRGECASAYYPTQHQAAEEAISQVKRQANNLLREKLKDLFPSRNAVCDEGRNRFYSISNSVADFHSLPGYRIPPFPGEVVITLSLPDTQ